MNHYYSIDDWAMLFIEAGFRLLKQQVDCPYAVTEYLVFEK